MTQQETVASTRPPTAGITSSGSSGFLRRSLPVLSMLLATLIGTLLPTVRTPSFYFWDDTAGVAVGVWQRIAESVLSGASPFLHLDMWRGGNLIAEAATGMWNPIMLGLMVGTYPIDDVGIAITVAKIALFLAMAGGVYLLARGYGASSWLAAVAGTTLPLSGWSIFMDGSSWINGTAIAAFTPWAWWALRRCYLRGFRPWDIVVAVVVGYLVPSTGNPYGVLSLAVVFLAVAIEALLARRARDIWWLIAIGMGTVLLVVVVYLPFVLTSAYGFRANSGIWNDEFLSVSVSDLLGMSTPTHHPYIMMWGRPMGFPGTYLAWFVLPLLPWLRWNTLRTSWRTLSGILVFGLFFLMFTLGPSQLGMFRWPARLLPFLYLAIIVLFVVLASAGLHRSRIGLRGSISACIILLSAWIAFSDVPGAWKWHALVTVIVAGGVALVVWWCRDRGPQMFLVLAGGMVLFLIPQLALTASNQNVADYRMPTSKSELRAQFEERSDGLVIQVFDIQELVQRFPPEERWEHLLAGNMPSVAGFESTTAYSGIGFTAFDDALCLTYNGGSCPALWNALWNTPKGADQDLSDLLRAMHVVVLNGYAENNNVPEGWSLADETDVVAIYERDEALPFPDGTVSAWSDGVTVDSDERVGTTGERLTVSTEQSGHRLLTFARIAWPGYSATVDGEPIATQIGPAGLLQVELPPALDAAQIELHYTPPGLSAGIAAAAIGVALIVLTVAWSTMRSRLTKRSLGQRRSDSVR